MALARSTRRIALTKPSASSERVLDELTGWVARDMNYWSQRNERFQRDQRLFQLSRPEGSGTWTKNDSDILILNDPKVLLKKFSRLIARHPNIIEVAPSAPELQSVAQRIENWLYNFDLSLAHRWAAGLHNPYRYDQAFFVCLRGWLCERLLLFPDGEEEMPSDPAALYDHQVIDPAHVYPTAAARGMRRILHAYTVTAEELLADPLVADADLKDLEEADDRQRVNVRAYYWKTTDGGWWHAVMADSQWVKKPTELGYNPWIITLANGASYRATPWDETDYLNQIGTGLLDEGADTFTQLNRAATKLNALLSMEANPPITVYSSDGQPRKITFGPGSRLFLTQKDKLEAHRVGPNMGDYQAFWDILTQRAKWAGFNTALFADFNGEGGFSQTVMTAAGRDVLHPFAGAINEADVLRYKLALTLYRDFGPATPLQTRMAPDSLGIAMQSTITAVDIQRQGVLVDVSRQDMTPQELIQKINAALTMVQAKAISLRTARGKEWIGVKNPDAENLQVLAEQVYLSPDVVKALTPIALTTTGQQMLAALWSTLQSGVPQPGSPASSQLGAPQPSAPGSVPPPGGPNQPLSASILSPVMQTGNPLTNTQVGQASPDQAMMNQLLALLNGGAAGGAGLGGTPPNPLLRSPIPPFLPPNRGMPLPIFGR